MLVLPNARFAQRSCAKSMYHQGHNPNFLFMRERPFVELLRPRNP